MTTRQNGRPSQLFRNLNAKIASIPMVLTALVVFLGGTAWTVLYSFTSSKLLPRLNFVGLDQYERLWAAPRWMTAIENLAIYGFLSLIFSLVIGFLLAALLDQKIRFEDTFRTIFLYPFALSFIVTNDNACVLIEFDISSVLTAYTAFSANDNGFNDVTFLDNATWCCFLNCTYDNIADVSNFTARTTKHFYC